jgi:predicted ATP-binding protein involved in virulence
MTLFDPLTQVASAEFLLATQKEDSPLFRLFRSVLGPVLGPELGVILEQGRVEFTSEGDVVQAVDLPDGFRSSVAWLVDLCWVWCAKNPERAGTATPADVDAIVLIDEIDLHLHPSLQRILVPRLRETFPRIQWIVTTHSPLILSSFDSSEIVALDRREPGGVRFLDRQILGFSTDEIYTWLMGTPATGAAVEKMLSAGDKGTGAALEELAQLLEATPETDEATAKLRVRERLDRLKRRAR